MRIVLPSTFWLHFQGSQALQNACQMYPKWNPKLTKSVTNQKIRESKKHVKKDCPEVGKSIKMTSKWGPGGRRKVRKSSKIKQFPTFAKMAPMGVPGSKRRPKGIQKASKRIPKGVQKA